MGCRESPHVNSMQHADLLALTADDLAALTNRGTVKRAQRELAAGEMDCKIQLNPAGDLVISWSDGIVCQIPAGRTVHDAICSSDAVGISRHVIRSVLAYQHQYRKHQASDNYRTSERNSPAGSLPGAGPKRIDGRQPDLSSVLTGPDDITVSGRSPALDEQPQTDTGNCEQQISASARHAEAWDPGSITDDELVARFRKAAITQARERFLQGVVVELVRGTKPAARFFDGCNVRFLVPGDLRYVAADCSDSLLSTWVPLAVWAFRELPADRPAGLLSLHQPELPTPHAVFDNLNPLLEELARDGLSNLSPTWSPRASRVVQSLQEEGLVWPAELVIDLQHQCEMYCQHDARFEPQQMVQLLGELTARRRAIINRSPNVSQLLVRGTKSDRSTRIASGRFIGVGLGVRARKRHTTISAYLQDVDSGSVVAIEQTFANPDPQSGQTLPGFADLASASAIRGLSFASMATSQLLLKSGQRTASGQLVLPRTASSLTLHPQSFQWEQLQPPFAVDDFSQLAARVESLPPACLRPRRSTDNLYAIAVHGADQVAFDSARQRLVARLRDSQGNFAELSHAFHSRCSEEFDSLAKALEQCGGQVRFVCGHIRASGQGLEVQPVSLVLDDGERRTGLFPWLKRSQSTYRRDDSCQSENAYEVDSDCESPVSEFLQRIDEQLGDLLITGLSRCDAGTWNALAEYGQTLGFVSLIVPVTALADALSTRLNTLRWSAGEAFAAVQELCLLSRLAQD